MNKTLLAVSLLTAGLTFGQVGINTNSPKATLEIVSKNTPTVYDGLIAPKLTGAQLAGKTYTGEQSGAIVYVTSAAPTLTGQVANVSQSGYYFFDGSIWKTIGGSAGITQITNELTSSGNTMTSKVNGISSSANIITTNTLVKGNTGTNEIISTVNNQSATVEVPNLYTANGTISENRTVSLAGSNNTVTFTRTTSSGTTDVPILSTNGSVQTIALRLDSDARLKENIKAIDGNLALQLRPVTYNWNKAGKEKGGNDKLQYGFIAQEVEKVMPDAVFTDKDGYKSVNYIEVIPVITQKLKDQQQIIDELIKRLDELEKKSK